MFCFKCGKKLPARVINCPDCDTPQKRRQRYRRRMILGLFIFLAGAVAGSLFDTLFFKGQAWKHSFLGYFTAVPPLSPVASPTVIFSHSGITNDESQVSIASDTEATSVNTGFTIASAEQNPVIEAVLASSASPVLEIASESEQASTTLSVSVPVIASTVAEIPSPASSPATTSVLAVVEQTFPAGRLVFSKVEAIEKGSGSNYHGFMARNGSELIFASNRLKVGDAPTYLCFSKKPESGATPEKAFDWPGNVWTPETTPDSNMIVFSSDSTKPEHIFLYDRRTKNSMPLTNGNSKNMMPAVSPDGKLIAFVSNRKGSNNIWLIGIDGASLMQITTGTHDDREPRWAPDGQSLLFTRILEPLKKSHIMRVQLEPLGEPQAIVSAASRNWLADLSPDGTMLAYVRSESDDGSKNTLILREINTGKEQTLKLLAGAECFRPIWNADCSGFIFHASSSAGKSLYQAYFAREKD